MGTAVRRTRHQQEAIDGIAVMLNGSEGERIAKIAQANHGRHLDPVELISEAMIAIILAVDKGAEILDPAGYAYRVMRNTLVDALGGDIDETDLDKFRDQTPPVVGSDRDPLDLPEPSQSDVNAVFDEIRIGLEAAGASVGQVSAALAKLALGDANSIYVADLPQPIAGAAPTDAQWWPCAFLATRDRSMFPHEGRAGQAARQRRSRFIGSTKKLLEKLTTGLAPVAGGE